MIDAAPPSGDSVEAGSSSPEQPASAIPSGGLPAKYAPKIAAYARGPFLDPELVMPSEWKWRNTRTFTVRTGGQEWRAIRVSSGGEFIGYWAVELLIEPEGLE